MEPASLPTILEIKRTLGGARKEFRCRLVERQSDRAIVLFVADRAYQVPGLALPPGTVTLGHFWPGRPYNVYHWMQPSGTTLAHYFNLATDTSIDAETIRWTDLTLDVLVQPGTPPVVLDEDELPADLDPDTRSRIDAARSAVLEQQGAVVANLEEQAGAIWPRLFGVSRL